MSKSADRVESNVRHISDDRLKLKGGEPLNPHMRCLNKVDRLEIDSLIDGGLVLSNSPGDYLRCCQASDSGDGARR